MREVERTGVKLEYVSVPGRRTTHRRSITKGEREDLVERDVIVRCNSCGDWHPNSRQGHTFKEVEQTIGGDDD